MQQGILGGFFFSTNNSSCPFFKGTLMYIGCFRDLSRGTQNSMHLGFWCLVIWKSIFLFFTWDYLFIFRQIGLEIENDIFLIFQMNLAGSIIRRKHALRFALNGGWTFGLLVLLYSIKVCLQKRSYKIGNIRNKNRTFL